MTLNFGNKEFRNLQGQVLFNANEIQALKQLQLSGINLKDIVADESDLPELVVGDAYLVGNTTPFDLYIGLIDHWFMVGKFPAAGPQGIAGLPGPQGEQGESTKWTIGTDLPLSGNEGDLHLKFDGKVYRYNGTEWIYNLSIRGPQGVQGPIGERGLTGAQGPQGETGPKGDTSPAVTIKAILGNLNQLPDANLVPRNTAYIIDSTIYIIVELAGGFLAWQAAGAISEYATALQISFDDNGLSIKGGNVQSNLAAVNLYVGRMRVNGKGFVLNGVFHDVTLLAEDIYSEYFAEPIEDSVIYLDNNKVPTTRTINGKALSSNITLVAGDIEVEKGHFQADNISDALDLLEDSKATKAELNSTTTTINTALAGKQANIVDSGWLELSAFTGQAGTPMEGLPSFSEGSLKIRKINFGSYSLLKYVGQIKIPENASYNYGTSDYVIVGIPVGYRIGTHKASCVSCSLSETFTGELTIGYYMISIPVIQCRTNQSYFSSMKNKWISIDETFIIQN